MKNVLVTGGCGFIGSNFVRYMLNKYNDIKICNVDKLTYAGNPENLKDIENDPRYKFFKADIADNNAIEPIVRDEQIDTIVNFAAETHVDRSIEKPGDFIITDVYGAYVLLENARKYNITKFIQISTDEVYGSIDKGSFTEESPLTPRNPYSASKAGGDRFAYSYFTTYNVPVIITRASNNYGPYQYPEKLIPLFVTNALEDKNLPLYGDGKNIRDWLHVLDHCSGVDYIINNGTNGEVYNIGGGNETENIEITKKILKTLGKDESLIKKVEDRLGHDKRYSLDCSKLRALGWEPKHQFPEALEETIQWYVDNQDWWKKLKSGEYLDYYKKQYSNR